VFDLDSSVGTGMAQRLNAAFEVQRQLLDTHLDALGANAAQDTAIGGEAIEDFRKGAARPGIHEASSAPDLPGILQFKSEHRGVFEQALGFEVPDAIYNTLIQKRFNRVIEGLANTWLHELLSRGVVATRPAGAQFENKTLVIRNVQSKRETVVASIWELIDLAGASSTFKTRVPRSRPVLIRKWLPPPSCSVANCSVSTSLSTLAKPKAARKRRYRQ